MKRAFTSANADSGQLVFILGHPLEHSISPVMQNAAFRNERLNWHYTPLDVSSDQVADILLAMREMLVRGANITVPYKEKILPYLDGAESEVEWLGSVNTIYRRGSKLLGASTDGEGFLRSLGPRRRRLKGSRGLLIGAGGAARAVAGAITQSGIKTLYIANRTVGRARELAKDLKDHCRQIQVESLFLGEAEKILPSCDWVIQGTSVGLKDGDPSPIRLGSIPDTSWVIDLIYHRRTAFLKEAQGCGLPHMDGRGMLLHQGALSFELWTGRQAPLRVMQEALLRHLAR